MSRGPRQRGPAEGLSAAAGQATSGQTIHDLVRAIQAGEVSGRALAPEDRQRCVEFLLAEGYSVVEISEVLKVHERTIQRDKLAIRNANALQRDESLPGRMAGYLVAEAEHSMSLLGRVARDRETPAAVKVEIARTRFGILDRLVERLQSLGYLPTAAQEIRADLTHRVEEPPDMAALEAEFTVVTALVEQLAPGDGAARARLEELKAAISRTSLAHGIEDLKQSMDAKQESQDGPGPDPAQGAA